MISEHNNPNRYRWIALVVDLKNGREHLSQSVNFFGTHVNFRIAFLCGFRPLSRAEIAVERIDGELFTLQKYYIGIF